MGLIRDALLVGTFVGVRNLWKGHERENLLKLSGKGKSVLVTGAGSGIGRATALLFMEKEWKVFALDVNSNGLEELKRISEEKGWDLTTIRCDLSDVEEIKRACQEIQASVSGLDALVNNAGVGFPFPVAEVPDAMLEKQFKVNLFAPMLLTKTLFHLLTSKPSGGTVINVTSISGLFAWPWLGGYAATKYALEGYSDTLRKEVKACGINLRVVKVEPGGVATNFTNTFNDQMKKWRDENPDLKVSKFAKGYKTSWETSDWLKQTPEDLAKVIVAAATENNPDAAYCSMTPVCRVFFWGLYYLPPFISDKLSSKL